MRRTGICYEIKVKDFVRKISNFSNLNKSTRNAQELENIY